MKWTQDLTHDIRTMTGYDDVDGADNPYGGARGEFTEENRQALTEHFLKVRDNCSAILEIGVCRNDDLSSTHCFLKNKKQETIYLGIDIDDKSFLDNKEQNIFTLKNTSMDLPGNFNVMQQLGIKQFDFIFIDGWHSINNVMTEWEYTQLLGPNGIVGFHDTNYHPGPNRFVNALNTDKWHVVKACPDDYGISFAWRK
jgi:hypothetical protein